MEISLQIDSNEQSVSMSIGHHEKGQDISIIADNIICVFKRMSTFNLKFTISDKQRFYMSMRINRWYSQYTQKIPVHGEQGSFARQRLLTEGLMI